MATKYPLNIDDNVSLPQAINLTTPVDAPSVNNLRQAVLAIETELGVLPSGTYGTVRARLDALEAGGGGGGGGVVSVSNNSVKIVPVATNLNFTGSVTVTDSGSGTATINVTGGGGNPSQGGSGILNVSNGSGGWQTTSWTGAGSTLTASGSASIISTTSLSLRGGTNTFLWPSVDGISNQALLTNGSGTLSFGSVINAGDTVAPTVLYVNGSGNDNNAGTIGSPLQTVDKALQKIGPIVRSDCIIYITGASNLANGYSCVELNKERQYNANLAIYGDSWTVVAAGPFTSTGYSGATLTASAAGFTTDQYVGQIVEILTSSDSSLVGLKRSIIRTTAPGSLDLLAGFPSSVPNGTTFRIIKSNVVFNLDTISSGSGEYRVVRIKAPETKSFSYYNGYSLLLRGLTFNSPDQTNSIEFQGNIYAFGVTYNDNSGNSYFTHTSGEIGVMSYSYFSNPDLTVDKLNGLAYVHALISGSSISTTSSSGIGSSIYISSSKIDRLGVISGQLAFDQNTFARVASLRIIGFDYSFTSGALWHDKSSVVYYGYSSPGPNAGLMLISTPSTTTQLVVEEGSHISFTTGTFTVTSGTGRWLIRHRSTVTFLSVQPTILGYVEMVSGAECRLVGVDGSTVSGGFTCGYITPATQTTFAVNDYIMSLSDGSAAFRSA